ncbi:MAG: DinB family protein [Flavobacteriaceae bacterium]|nr:DinB family protein [Flavobacteriaceae bacterium]
MSLTTRITKQLYVLVTALIIVTPLTIVNGQESPKVTGPFEKYFEGTRSYTMDMAEAMPADKYTFRPTDSVRSFGEQLAHIALSSKMLLDVFINGKSMPTEEEFARDFEIEKEIGADKKACIAALNDAFEAIRTTYDNMTPEQLKETFVVPFDPNNATFTKDRGFEFIKDHLLHHRGQALVSLRMQGVPAPPYRLY